MLIISDTSPISSLFQIGLLDVLRQLYITVHIPKAVRDELYIVSQQAEAIEGESWIITTTPNDQDMVERLNKVLDRGEAEAIALALENKDSTLLIDELAGRTIADERGIIVVGVLGVLIAAKQRELIPEVAVHIAQLRDLGFYLSQPLVDRVLKGLGEL